MKKRRSRVPEFLIILLLGSSIIPWADSRISLIRSPEDRGNWRLSGGEVLASGESESVPRNQVLLEINTGTW